MDVPVRSVEWVSIRGPATVVDEISPCIWISSLMWLWMGIESFGRKLVHSGVIHSFIGADKHRTGNAD